MCASLSTTSRFRSGSTRTTKPVTQAQTVISQKRNLREAVRRGARMLDGVKPGWATELGKSFTSAAGILDTLGLTYEGLATQLPKAKRYPDESRVEIDGRVYGFYAGSNVGRVIGYDEADNINNAAWKREIASRLAGTTAAA